MKNVITIILMLMQGVISAQFGFSLESVYHKEYFNVGLLITSNDERHVFGVSKSIVCAPADIDSYKFGYGYMLKKNSYPYLEVTYGRLKDYDPKKLGFTIGYTFKGFHLGYDFRDGIRIGYYLLVFRNRD